MAVTADTIFHNGVVWAGRGEPAGATAVAVREGRIAAVGADDDVLNLRGPGTGVVNLGGQTLLPGFIDAHAHIWKIGHLLTTLLDVRPASSLADLCRRVAMRAGQQAETEWVQGRGYNEARFPEGRGPTRADLDAVVSDRPVVLMRTCAHIVACNSRALEIAGIGPDTPDPPGGEIDRGPGGEPTGILRETAMGLVLRKVSAPSDEQYSAMITAALRHQLTLGITSTTDAGVAPPLQETYRRLDAARQLPARVNVMALRLVDGSGAVPLPDQRVRTDRLQIDTVKFFADGGLSGATAALSVPYRDTDSRGVLRFDTRELLALAREAHDAGWRIATHAIGDVAIDQVLGVYESLGPGPVGHRIEHFGLPDAAALARASRLGVTAVPQAIFLRELGGNFRRYLPDTLLPRAYPLRSMLDAGVTVALSSDAPVVVDDSPLSGIEAALLRRDDSGHTLAPDEALTLEEALDGYTRAAAAAAGHDGERGVLRQGMQADLVILSGNPFATAPTALPSLRVTQTWVGGRMAFER